MTPPDDAAAAHASAIARGDIPVWTVTESPTDFPGRFVARLHVIRPGGIAATSVHLVATDIDRLRRLLPRGLYHMPRYAEDDHCIVETWL